MASSGPRLMSPIGLALIGDAFSSTCGYSYSGNHASHYDICRLRWKMVLSHIFRALQFQGYLSTHPRQRNKNLCKIKAHTSGILQRPKQTTMQPQDVESSLEIGDLFYRYLLWVELEIGDGGWWMVDVCQIGWGLCRIVLMID